ncbi:MAG: hypothetical protein KJZ80_05650 [Hyphomicrobiaceae bacterium]|nr:hypothetical protein [Hyphomicrobiaceae bacterium]
MQQKIDVHDMMRVAAKADPRTAIGETEPDDYDDGLLAAGGPIIVASAVAALGIATMTFLASGEALFAIAICVVYTAMFFGVPLTMTRIRAGRDERWRGDTPHRRHQAVATFTGAIRRHEAVMQMVIVPVGVAFAFAAFSVIWLLTRPW